VVAIAEGMIILARLTAVVIVENVDAEAVVECVRFLARFKLGNSLQGSFSQRASFTSDFVLSNTLDVWYATVKRRDELVQMTELALSIRSGNPLVAGHHQSLPNFCTIVTQSVAGTSTAFTISGVCGNRRDTGDGGQAKNTDDPHRRVEPAALEKRQQPDHSVARERPPETAAARDAACSSARERSLATNASMRWR